MRKLITLFAVSLLCSASLMGQNLDTLQASVYFNFDKDALTSKSLETLNGITGGKNVIQIEIFGHTDNVGNVDYNLDLSQRRANSVKQFFTNEGYHPAIIKIGFYGEDRPLKPNETENDKAINRRVDVLMITQDLEEKMPIDDEMPKQNDFSWLENNDNKIEDLIKEINTDIQVFSISNQKDTIIKTKGGMIVSIPNGAFECDCDENTTINLQIQETLTLSDALRNGLMTTDKDGRPLKTGGMAKFSAVASGGQAVKLKKEIDVLVPTKQLDNKMKEYRGEIKTTTYQNENGETTTREEVVWSNTQFSVTRDWQRWAERSARNWDLSNRSEPCCDESCIERMSKSKEQRLKKRRPEEYKVYLKGIEKAKKQLAKRCEAYQKMKIAEQNSNNNAQNNPIRAANKVSTEIKNPYYTVKLKTLDYFNCDYYPFQNEEKPMITMKANVPCRNGVDLYYISKKYNMITRGNYSDRGFRMIEGEKVVILGLGVDKDKNPMIAIREVTATEDVFDLDFQKTTKEELLKKVAELDNAD